MNNHRSKRLRYLFPAFATAGLLLSACGASGTANQASPTHTAPATPAASGPAVAQAAATILPAVQVKDVRTGTDVDLATLSPADEPTLVWAWAPHCPSCNAEAPKVQEFSKAHTSDVAVVGVGTQDSLGEAEEFVNRHKLTTPTMVWDSGFKSWQAMNINSMPTWILYSPDGTVLGRWSGQFPESQITAAIA